MTDTVQWFRCISKILLKKSSFQMVSSAILEFIDLNQSFLANNGHDLP